jgi:hypothetical protein
LLNDVPVDGSAPVRVGDRIRLGFTVPQIEFLAIASTVPPATQGFGETAGVDFRHEGEKKKFKVMKWRWIVERTFAWLGRYRRLSKDYEGTRESSESWIYIAMAYLMLRCLDAA